MAYATVQEVFEMVLRLDPVKLQGFNGVVRFDLAGRAVASGR